MKKIKAGYNKFIGKTHIPVWLAIVLALTMILRIPTFFEPFSYGDEMIYLTLGEGVRQGLTLYKDLHDNKPPLLYLFAGIAGNVFWFKAILAFWNLITIVLFWHLAKALFPKNQRLHKIATAMFALLTTLPLLEGNIANAEMFMIGPTIAAFLIIFSRKLNFRNLFGAGLFFAIATLFKVPAAFDILAIVFFWIISLGIKTKGIKQTLKYTLFIALGWFAPIAFTLLWYGLAGAFKEYLVAAFLQNLGYLSTWRPAANSGSLLVRNLPFFIRGALVIAVSLLLYIKKARLSRQFIFLTLWLIFGLFAVTLSERPYPHYLLQVVPAISLLLGILFADRSLGQTLAIAPLGLALLVPVYYHFWHYPSLPYYVNFTKFALGTIEREEYFSRFGSQVSTNYEIADFLINSSKPSDKVFVWGPDGSTIYALSRRLPPGKYVIDYHINDFSTRSDEASLLASSRPKFIIILPGASPFPELVPVLRKSYIPLLTLRGAEIWRVQDTTLSK
jgi:hypothetical protein